MLSEWRKFRGWSILEFFLSSPGAKPHIKELARRLNVSPQTSNRYLRLYEAEKLLCAEPTGNLVLFYLNNRHPLVKELKRLYFSLLLHDSRFTDDFIQNNPDVVGLLLYGSHASGEYSEKSDVELLVISRSRGMDMSEVKKLEARLNKEVKATVYTAGEWREFIRKGDPFIKSVLGKHVLLYGEDVLLQLKGSLHSEKAHAVKSHTVREAKICDGKAMDYVCEEE